MDAVCLGSPGVPRDATAIEKLTAEIWRFSAMPPENNHATAADRTTY